MAMRSGVLAGQLLANPQALPRLRLSEVFMSKLLKRRWTLSISDSKIHQVIQRHGPQGSSFKLNTSPSFDDAVMWRDKGNGYFYVVRDDLLHPLINGNKARKLDGLLPLLEDYSVTDVVTCGGCQSAHAAAIAILCAERGLKSHLLLRGEQPEILTGYNLISTVYGNVKYIPRSIYANREEMLKSHAELVAGDTGLVLGFDEILDCSYLSHTSAAPNSMHMDESEDCQRKVAIVNEGASDAVAILGCIRLVQYLSQNHLLGKARALKLVVDAGTGTTAIGLGLGILLLGLPWEVNAVMLADTIEGYRQQEERLISEFSKHLDLRLFDRSSNTLHGGIVHWVERCRPRKFGNVLEGEVEMCQQIAQQSGILLDPVYTLAAWDTAKLLSEKGATGGTEVVLLHTGGTLGMFGLAQRYKTYFRSLKRTIQL